MHESARTEQVAVRRYASHYTLVGPPLLILPIDEAVAKLAQSGFLREWIEKKIADALLGGEILEHRGEPSDDGWKGRDDGLVSRYALATVEEMESYVSAGNYSAVVGRKLTQRAQETVVRFDFKKDRGDLPRQARILLAALEKVAAGGDKLSAAAVELCVNDPAVVADLNTRQPASRIWGFYFSSRFKKEGFAVEVGE